MRRLNYSDEEKETRRRTKRIRKQIKREKERIKIRIKKMKNKMEKGKRRNGHARRWLVESSRHEND